MTSRWSRLSEGIGQFYSVWLFSFSGQIRSVRGTRLSRAYWGIEVKSVSEIHFLQSAQEQKKCLLLCLFSDRLWIDSVTLALIAWIFYTLARSYWICSDSCYSNIGYVGHDAPMLVWGIAPWSLFIHLGQFLRESRQTEQLHHLDFNSKLQTGIPLPVSYHLAAVIPESNFR